MGAGSEADVVPRLLGASAKCESTGVPGARYRTAMKLRGVLVITCVAAPASAHPDREPALGVTAGYAVSATTDSNDERYGPLIGLSLAWELPGLDHPDPVKGARPMVDVTLVPEVSVLTTGDDVMLLGGVRLDLRSAAPPDSLVPYYRRGHMWIAPRVGVSRRADSRVVGGDLGVGFYRDSGWRVDWSAGLVGWVTDDVTCLECRKPLYLQLHTALNLTGSL